MHNIKIRAYIDMQAQSGFQKMQQSPNKMQQLKDYSVNKYLIRVDQTTIQNELQTSYLQYKQNKININRCQKIINHIKTGVGVVCAVVHQLWRQIIPQFFRGNMRRARTQPIKIQDKQEQQLFGQFKQKRKTFFLIVYEADCSQQDAANALQKASFVVAEGFGISQAELRRRTNSFIWKVPNLQVFRTFTIHFFRFNCFGEMLWFGNLTKNVLDEQVQRTNFMEEFKEELEGVVRKYDDMEKEFIGFYMEKEDRAYLE